MAAAGRARVGQKSNLKHITHANKVLPLPENLLSSMTRTRVHAEERIRARMEAFELHRLSAEERAIRQRARSQSNVKKGNTARIAQLRKEHSARMKKAADLLARADTLRVKPSTFDIPVADPTTGQLWWAQTSVWWNTPAWVVFFEDDGLHFAGEQMVNDTVGLFKGFIYVLAQFGLGPDRMPPGTNFISTPTANILGMVFGETTANFLDFADQWSKCWLTTRQTILTPPQQIPPPGQIFGQEILGDSINTNTLIFIEDELDGQFTNLPGYTALPPIRFQLDSVAQSMGIEIDLEFNFDVQLEGDDSHLKFGLVPQALNDLIQTFQWQLVPA